MFGENVPSGTGQKDLENRLHDISMLGETRQKKAKLNRGPR